MIEQVIKRDGAVEKFSADKINSMATWAIEAAKGVTWSDIAMDALKLLSKEVVTAQEIQEALIKVCLDKEDYQHNRVAGRLVLGNIRKESHAALTFFDHYYDMVEKGYYREMDYTEDEVEYLSSLIDHDTDLRYGYPTLRQFLDKYAVRDEDDNLLELPQYMYMAVAMSLLEKDSIEDVVMYYNKASQQKINIPSPVLAQQRTKNNTGVSCVISTAGDSLQGIEATKHVAFMATASSAGLGIEYDVRSPRDDVRKGYAKAGGKLPHYRVLDLITKEVKQSNRGGSATVSFNVLDPEIETLLNLKLKRSPETKRIDQLDYSLVWNNEFLKHAAQKQPWKLFSKKKNPDAHDNFYGSIWGTQLYDNESKTVSAFGILKQFSDNRLETGRLYWTNIDNVNEHTPWNDNIRLSNLCVAPETEILTKNGYIPIAELENEFIEVWNGFEWSEVEVFKTGENQQLLKVVTDSGYELECTPYHKFYIFDGYGKPYKEVRAHELSENDKLMKFDLPVIEGSVSLDKAYDNGFYSGDGCITPQGQRIYLYHEKRELKPYFTPEKGWLIQEDQNREYTHYKTLKDKFFVPTSDYTINSRLEWLAGYLDADGCIYRNGTNEAIVATSVEKEFLKEIQKMLQTLGVSCKIKPLASEGFYQMPANDGTGEMKDFWCKEIHRLLISSYDSYKLLTLGLKTRRLKINKRLPQREAKQFVKVLAVSDEGRIDDTYCFTEPKRNLGVFNGICTGQCQEVLLPTKPYNNVMELYKDTYEEGDGVTAQCFLSAIDVARIEDDKDYAETCYIVLKSLDNLIENMNYPFPQFKATAQLFRSVGVGITNLAYHLAYKGKKYSDKEYLHYLAERHYYYLLKASIKLAEERGKFDYFYKTKWAEVWTPLKTYKNTVDDIASPANVRYNWDKLERAIKQYGVRFSTLAAFMPCESSSVMGNGTNGLYPIRDKLMYKESKRGHIQFFAPHCDELEYESAYDVDPYDLIDMYALFQKFCDQTISADTYVDTTKSVDGKVSSSDLIKRIFYANKVGMKTWYYNNTKTGRGQEKKENGCESCSL